MNKREGEVYTIDSTAYREACRSVNSDPFLLSEKNFKVLDNCREIGLPYASNRIQFLTSILFVNNTGGEDWYVDFGSGVIPLIYNVSNYKDVAGDTLSECSMFAAKGTVEYVGIPQDLIPWTNWKESITAMIYSETVYVHSIVVFDYNHLFSVVQESTTCHPAKLYDSVFDYCKEASTGYWQIAKEMARVFDIMKGVNHG